MSLKLSLEGCTSGDNWSALSEIFHNFKELMASLKVFYVLNVTFFRILLEYIIERNPF